MSSEKPEIDPAKPEIDAADEDTAGERTTEAQSGVAAKARARAQSQKSTEKSSGNREFTVSARALKRVGAGIVAIAVIAGLVFGGWKLYEAKSELSAFDDSKAAAAGFVDEYFAVAMGENPTPQALKEKVGPLTTGDLRTRLDTDASKTVEFVKSSKLANVETKINASMVESFDDSRAVTVLAVEFTGTSATAPGGGKFLSLLQLTLDQVDGEWLVSDMGMVPGMESGAPTGQPGGGAPGGAPVPAPAPGQPQPAG